MYAIELDGVRKAYGAAVALEGLSLRVEPDEVFALLGANGAGKVRYLLRRGGLSAPETELLAACEAVGLGREAAGRPVGTYSKGLRPKVALALAVARKSGVLLLDEPTSGLDPQASNELSGAVRRMSEGGATVLMATHDLFRAHDGARVRGASPTPRGRERRGVRSIDAARHFRRARGPRLARQIVDRVRGAPGRRAARRLRCDLRRGGPVRLVAASAAGEPYRAPAWSADGRALFVTAGADDGGCFVERVGLDGAERARVTRGRSSAMPPRRSPDGRRLAVTLWEAGTIYVRLPGRPLTGREGTWRP